MAKVERAHWERAADAMFREGWRDHENLSRVIDRFDDTLWRKVTVFAMAQAIADAEQRGREAGKAEERADVLSWLRGVGDQYMNGDMVPCDEFTGEAYHQAANEIEQGRHAVRGASKHEGGGGSDG